MSSNEEYPAKLILVILILVSLTSIFYLLGFRPLFNEYRGLLADAEEIKDESAELREYAQRREILRRKKDELAEQMQAKKEQFAPAGEMGFVMEKLEERIAHMDLFLLSFQPREGARDRFYPQRRLAVQMVGSFPALIEFMDILDEFPHHVELTELQVTSKEEDQLAIKVEIGYYLREGGD